MKSTIMQVFNPTITEDTELGEVEMEARVCIGKILDRYATDEMREVHESARVKANRVMIHGVTVGSSVDNTTPEGKLRQVYIQLAKLAKVDTIDRFDEILVNIEKILLQLLKGITKNDIRAIARTYAPERETSIEYRYPDNVVSFPKR